MNFEAVTRAFEENFARRGELGASVSVWQGETEVLSLHSGFEDREKKRPWTEETAVLVWSATKGVAAGCVLHALQSHGVALDERVATIWPEFGQAGKSDITLGELLSHQAGLAALTLPPADAPDVYDYSGVVQALERQAPLWPRRSGHGYHPRTFGWLLDEVVRRVTGSTLGAYWRNVFAEPLSLDFWIGLSADRVNTVATVFAPRVAPPEDEFLRAFSDPESLTNRAFGSPRGILTPSAMNSPEARCAAFPAFGGIGTARSLGKFYALLANGGLWDGRRFFEAETIAQMTTTLTDGEDKVLRNHTAFSAGFMKDPMSADGEKLRRMFGPSPLAFGQPGAGGSLAFADPEHGIAFAYTMNQMEPGVLGNEKTRSLSAALYS